jgi:hypothetical protein
VTEGDIHEINIARALDLTKGSIMAIDMDYTDYRVGVWDKQNARIVVLLTNHLKFRSSINWSLSNLVAMLRCNLFPCRDLWLWLDNPFEVPDTVPGEERLVLALRKLDSIWKMKT